MGDLLKVKLREAIRTALRARPPTLPANVLQVDVLSERVPVVGLLILRDGEPRETEHMLSLFSHQHRTAVGRTCFLEHEGAR